MRCWSRRRRRSAGLELVAAELDHPRVRRALVHRTEVRIWATPDGAGLLTVGRGVAGRWEVSLEVEPARTGARPRHRARRRGTRPHPGRRAALGAGRPGQHRVAARLPRRGLPPGRRRGAVRPLRQRATAIAAAGPRLTKAAGSAAPAGRGARPSSQPPSRDGSARARRRRRPVARGRSARAFASRCPM